MQESLLLGLMVSDCKIPCTRTTVTLERSSFEPSDHNYVYIAFTNIAEITSIDVDKVSVWGVLNFLGSNLGLYPGMGLFQLLG